MSLKHSLTRSVIPATSLVIPARFWGATEFTEYNNYTADYWYLKANGATCSFADEDFALSVRCIKD